MELLNDALAPPMAAMLLVLVAIPGAMKASAARKALYR